jgi:hypothetical protein
VSEEKKEDKDKQPTEQEKYETEFNKAAEDVTKEPEIPKSEEQKQPEQPKGDEKPKPDEDKDKTQPKDQESESDKGELPKSEHHGKLESVEKALKDTQGYATKLSQQLSQLRKKNNELQKQLETQSEKGETQTTDKELLIDDEKLKKTYEEYPELKSVLDPLVKANKSLYKKIENNNKLLSETKSKEISDSDKEETKKASEDHYKNITKPGIEMVHPNFEKLIDEKFWEWIDNQSNGMQKLSKSSDPRDGVMVISAYKEHLSKQGKAKEDQKHQSDATNELPPSSSTNSTPPFGKKDKVGDYDEEFDKIASNYKG